MSNEAEQAVLGAMLLSSKGLDLIELIPDHFKTLEHKIIYQAIIDLDSQKLAYDAVTVHEHLERKGELVELAYLIQLANSGINHNNIGSYARLVLRDYSNKKLRETGFSIQMIAEQGGDFDANLEQSLNLFDALKMGGEKDLYDFKDNLESYTNHLQELLDKQGLDGFSTGLKTLDERIEGLKDGELILIGARPSMGKSALALQIANHVAQHEKVLFFSMEMPTRQVVMRTVASIASIDSKWLKGGLRQDDSGWGLLGNAMDKLIDHKLIIDDTPAHSLQSMKIVCKKNKDVRLVVVDYLQLMRGEGNNRNEQIGSISRGLKQLAKELNCPVIALSQLNRGLEQRKNKRPMMSDLRESGELEQDADIILFIYRDEVYYPEHAQNKGYAEIITAKFREGEIGTDFLATELQYSRFKDIQTFTYQPYGGGD